MEVSLLTLNFFVSDNPFTAIHLLKTTNIKLLFPVPWWRYVMFRKVYIRRQRRKYENTKIDAKGIVTVSFTIH